mmetsp:Transcript_13922/g.40355  ORF Transcript_13922/g.40355 Transcript_13922/m.40355 type:complete len:326 (+) Transcript_13922:2585-3562(+)
MRPWIAADATAAPRPQQACPVLAAAAPACAPPRACLDALAQTLARCLTAPCATRPPPHRSCAAAEAPLRGNPCGRAPHGGRRGRAGPTRTRRYSSGAAPPPRSTCPVTGTHLPARPGWRAPPGGWLSASAPCWRRHVCAAAARPCGVPVHPAAAPALRPPRRCLHGQAPATSAAPPAGASAAVSPPRVCPARAAKPPATVPRQACPGGLLQGRSAARAALGVAPSRRQRAFPHPAAALPAAPLPPARLPRSRWRTSVHRSLGAATAQPRPRVAGHTAPPPAPLRCPACRRGRGPEAPDAPSARRGAASRPRRGGPACGRVPPVAY